MKYSSKRSKHVTSQESQEIKWINVDRRMNRYTTGNGMRLEENRMYPGMVMKDY